MSESRQSRFRIGIRTLLILTTIMGCIMAYYGMVWERYHRQWNALQQLEELGGGTSPQPFTLKNNLTTAIQWPVIVGFGYDRVGKLLAPKELFLVDINVGDDNIDLILNVPNVVAVKFGRDQISMASFDRLEKHGIKVNHWGLNDFILSSNFICVDSRYYEVDRQKINLQGIVRPNKKIEFYVDGVTNENKYVSRNLPFPIFSSCEFGLGLNWRDLEGRGFESKFSETENAGNFYDGLHHRLNKHKIKIGARKNNVFRMKWEFNSEFGGDSKAEFDVPFTEVFFTGKGPPVETVEQAKAWMEKHFDLDDFEEPIEDKNGWKQFRFILKLPVKE